MRGTPAVACASFATSLISASSQVPGLGSMAHQHDYHHMVFNANYGVIGLLDKLHGTRGGFDAHHARWNAKRGAKAARD